MQEIPAGVEAVIEAVNQELRLKPQHCGWLMFPKFGTIWHGVIDWSLP
jgi:hypothetical protein